METICDVTKFKYFGKITPLTKLNMGWFRNAPTTQINAVISCNNKIKLSFKKVDFRQKHIHFEIAIEQSKEKHEIH